MSDVEAWTAVLDAYEARLVAIRDATAAGDPSAVPPFVAPAGLAPMPDAVVERARALLVRSRELEQVISQARAAVHARLTAPQERGPVRRSRLDISV